MNLRFFKYQGAGNDFIMIDGRDSNVQLSENQVNQLCDRHFGIGADGLIIIREHESADFYMEYYNADGAIGSLCGNGSRCAIMFVADLGLTKEQYVFMAADGLHRASKEKDQVSLEMNKVNSWLSFGENFLIDTGSPHYLIHSQKIASQDMNGLGRQIRYSEEFAEEGVNVNLIEYHEDEQMLSMRTYERGVENETLACGTGALGVALSTVLFKIPVVTPVKIKAPGGLLEVDFKFTGEAFQEIILKGPAKYVFQGTIQVDA